ncbi:Maf family protein [Neisseria sp. Ec49-e6-T10]|uniref:Maf family protein n=1 Tax=Neisseria sp. Ec49-e6-T10 TaxID=3140744 RepID=UPI003EBF9905
MKPLVYLASGSPRRFELLKQMGLNPQKILMTIDETPKDAELPEEYVKRVTLLKAHAAVERKKQLMLPKAPIIVADTIVSLNDTIYGKPKDPEQAKEILGILSGQTHQVISSVCVVYEGQFLQKEQISQVTLTQLTEQSIDAYIHTREPLDKAGAYGIQGLGALFVTHIAGSYSSVMGLPIFETAQLLEQCKIHLPDMSQLDQEKND